MALEASGGFLFALLSVYPLLAYYQPIGEHPVGCFRCGEGDKCVTAGLVDSSALFGLDPPGFVDCAVGEPVILFYPSQLALPFRLEV
jgi:hypothetical protein